MTLLLTGGAGFIGQHLARLLAARGYELLALDSLNPQVHLAPEASVEAFPGPVIVADVATEQAWDRLPEGITGVVHLAAETGTGQSMYERDRYERVNVDGTRRAAEFAADREIPLISLSSRAVYGEGRRTCPDHGLTFGAVCCERSTPEPSHEDDEHHPVSVYGETKSLAESAALALCQNVVPLSIVRPQNVIGPGQALHNPYTGVLAAFLAMLREDRPLTVYGDGSQTRDFIHVADLVSLLAWLVENPPAPTAPLVLNAGTGVRTTLLELAAAAIEGAPSESPGIVRVEVHRAGDIADACADLTRYRQVGAPEPTWKTRDAIIDFIAWSWDKPGAASQAWDTALGELRERGLTS